MTIYTGIHFQTGYDSKYFLIFTGGSVAGDVAVVSQSVRRRKRCVCVWREREREREREVVRLGHLEQQTERSIKKREGTRVRTWHLPCLG